MRKQKEIITRFPIGDELIKQVINNCDELFYLKSAKIVCLATNKKKSFISMISLMKGTEKVLTELDYKIIISIPNWEDISERSKEAVIHHVLNYCDLKEDRKGNEYWSIRKPDISEFTSTINRYGADYLEDLPNFFIAVSDEIKQYID